MTNVITKKPEIDMRILKVGSCSSRSGKSMLTYHIGCTPESTVHFRVYANSGNGFFSKEWLSLKTILELLPKGGQTFTAFDLQPLLRGKSVNTPEFLLAVLVEEGLVKAAEKKRSYELAEPSPFMDKIKLLIESKTALKDEDTHLNPPRRKLLPVKPLQSKTLRRS